MSNHYIATSGAGVPNNGVMFPSGLFGSGVPGSDLGAFLASLNATFGFNLTQHNFQLEFIPFGNAASFHGASGQLPPIGHHFELFIGEFFIRGKISHSDYTVTDGGTIVTLNVQDNRKNLTRVKIHTEDLGESVPSGVVSVARAFRKLNGLIDINGDPLDPNIKEYKRILEHGATYSQILEAIDLSFNEGLSAFPISILPTVEQLELNIGGTIEAIRFIFNLDPLDEVLTRVLQDTGFDWYWNMDGNLVNLINKKLPFDISEAGILDLVSQFGSLSGLNETKQIGFGSDLIQESTRFRLLGGHQEGIINSPLLSPIDGVDTTALDNNITFTKAWDLISIGFYDPDGFYRVYTPTEKELQLALAGIEQWTYFKIYQTSDPNGSPPGYGLDGDAGSVAAQNPAFQSRLDPLMPLAGEATGAGISGIRIISNRRDEEHNWVIDFYNRVRDHASRHYGRSYVAEGILYNQASGLLRLIDSAWANVENQLQGANLSQSGSVNGPFTNNYEINRQLGPISPFVADDFRVIAHCVLPQDTVYGPQGDDVPASFGNWTEDAPPFNPSGDGRHYIPVTLVEVGQRVINPRSDDLFSFEAFPEGTLLCQLPINAGPASGLLEDQVIANLATLLTVRTKLDGSGLRDILNPAIVLNAYQTLSGVAIPIESRLRYGQNYPTTWVQGEISENDEFVQLDDQFVPWTYFPIGNQTSLDVMTERAMRRVIGKIVPRNTSRYADFVQVGLPLLSFDSFADQSVGASGLFGQVTHGVNELNIGFGFDGFNTRYKIQSYFPKFGREAPLGERSRAILNGIINPIDFSFLSLANPIPPDSRDPSLPGSPELPPIFFDTEKRAVRVEITEVNNVFTLGSVGTPLPERYFGEDANLYTKPPQFSSSNPDFTEGAVCIDGFLNIGDAAIYNTDEFEGGGGTVIFRYFTGGRPFGNGTIVQVEQNNVDDATKYDVTIIDPTAALNGVTRALKGLSVLNGMVQIGDRTTLAAQGDAAISPGPSFDGIFINGTTTSNGLPIQIIDIMNPGTSGAFALCKQLNKTLDPVNNFVSGVVFPFPQFARIGDQGLAVTTIDQGNLIFIARQAFIGQ